MKTVRAILMATALGGAALSAHGASAANLLTNGGFETGNIGTGNYVYPGAALNSWTYGGSALVNASGSSAWYGGTAPTGGEGVQFAALQGGSSLSQSFTANASTLNLAWVSAGRPNYGCCNGDQTYGVFVDGNQVGGNFSTASGTNFSFQTLSLSGLSNGSTYNLAFKGLTSTDETAFLDNVILSNMAIAAPAGPPVVSVMGSNLPLAVGQQMVVDFDHPNAPGYSFTGGYVRSGAAGLDPGVSAPPMGDATNYETVLGGQVATLTSVNLLRSMSFFAGSPDSYNWIRFQGPGGYDYTLNGSQLFNPPTAYGGNQGVAMRINYDFGGALVNKISFGSDGNSFEFDSIAARGAVPEPASWALMILGFGALGAMLRRRRGMLALA